MKRILISCAVAAGLLPVPAFALGIGQLTLDSGLNEPLEARIALLSPTREELDTLNVALADTEAFRRAGVDRPFVLSNLRFEIVEGDSGVEYIRVSSHDAIREPFLNFLVELSWANGRLYREYTVLLDPPLYDARSAPAYTPAPAAPVAEAVPEAAETPAAPVIEAGTEYAAAPTFTGSEYGPTESSDTLWSIASRTRPDESITVQQMMLALLRANPEAFISGNVNGLKRGQILRVPGREDIGTVAPDQAMAEIKSQYAMWEDLRGTIATAPQQRPESSPAAAPAAAVTASAPAPVQEDTAELRLVAAADTGAGTNQDGVGGSGEAAQLKDRLAIASEQMASATQENAELKDKLTESEAIIADLKRLISLKDDELAALQQQMAAGGAAAPATPIEAPAEVPVEATVAEQEQEQKEAVPAAVPPETEAEPPAEVPAPVESGETAPEATPPASPAPAVEQPASKPAPAPVESAPGLVDQAIKFATDNLLIIGAGLGAVILLAVGFVAIGKFRSRMEADAAAAPDEEFPDFAVEDEDGAGEPIGSEDVTNVREKSAGAPVKTAASAKEDATMFALPPEPKAKGALAAKAVAAEPAPAAVSSEEALDAFHHEVNVFMAYEDWDQAESFVRDALGREPNNLDFHAKLLEVFFTSGNRRKYEAAAKTLHDVVGGAGPYWDNAVVMWNEMSPNRALFAAGGEEEEAPAATAAAGGGLLDLTAAASRQDAGLDFDLGDATAQPAAAEVAPPSEEAVLDITAGTEDAVIEEPAPESADMLDVTAAVGLEPEEAALDLEPAAGEEGILDLSGGEESPKADLLDVSAGGDLLDVTAQTDVGARQITDDDLLDVTSTAASARGDAAAEEVPAPVEESVGEHTLDFNLEDVPQVAVPEIEVEESSAGGGNVIEFESSGGGLELVAEDEPVAEEVSLDGGLELDMGDAADASDAGGLELDLTIDDVPAADKDEIDMEGTVEIPKLELELVDEDDDEDDDEDHTVFVPRSGDAQEQSVEDKMASQLDLAKAYVEMGTKESKETAKGILNQVLADGNEQQKRKAQELIRRIS